MNKQNRLIIKKRVMLLWGVSIFYGVLLLAAIPFMVDMRVILLVSLIPVQVSLVILIVHLGLRLCATKTVLWFAFFSFLPVLNLLVAMRVIVLANKALKRGGEA